MRFRTRSDAARYSARARWRAAEQRAEAERAAGIPDRELRADVRDPIEIDLTSYGGPKVRIEPRAGYIACRLIEGGEVVRCAALKTLLHELADRLPRTMSERHAA